MFEILKVYIPAVLLIAVGFVVALRFVAPPPPKELRLATGPAGAYYQIAGQKYREALARDGINVTIIETQGSIDNLRRLVGDKPAADIALVQGGLSADVDTSGLVALGGAFYEPVWVLVRAPVKAVRLAELKGRKIAIGAEGSGTRSLALQMLAANGISEQSADLVGFGTPAALMALSRNEIDAAFIVIGTPTQPMIDLLARGVVRLLSFNQADAYHMRFPFLVPVRLPMGAADLGSNVPGADVKLVAPTAALIAREDIHPALVTLFLNATRDIYGGVQLFAQPGTFPTRDHLDYPLHSDAVRFFERGPSFLFRYLPFGVAVWVERMVVLAIPLITLLIPIIRFAPPAYRWQVQRKIYRWYRALQRLETAAQTAESRDQRNAIRGELDEIQMRVATLKIPPSYAHQLYRLRMHLDYVRSQLT
jgi:TRAP transporter TAXI family solute receptor